MTEGRNDGKLCVWGVESNEHANALPPHVILGFIVLVIAHTNFN